LDLAFGVWKHFGIEDKITPMKCSHPKAIKMEDLNRNISCFHAFKEGIDCLFVVICGEAGTQPKTVTPTWNFSRLASQDRVFLQDFFGSWAVDYVPAAISWQVHFVEDILPFQPLAFDTRLDSAASLAPNLEFNFVRRVYENSISPRAHPKRDILICLVTRRSSIRIPQRDGLPDLIERTKSLAQSVNGLSD
jgi:hypothetical protein